MFNNNILKQQKTIATICKTIINLTMSQNNRFDNRNNTNNTNNTQTIANNSKQYKNNTINNKTIP